MKARLLALVFAAPLFACSSPDSTDAVGESVSEDELRSLRSGEVLGDISYGETKQDVEYTETPTYRAFAFVGKVGDEIAIDVAAAGADARAWLLSSSYATLKSNDDASSSTKDSRITHKLTKSGKHYIAFRESNFEDATFAITLSKVGAPPPPPPPADPFSDAYCAGSAMTQAQAASRLGAGGVHVRVGSFNIVERTRTCTSVTGCGPWKVEPRVSFYSSHRQRAWSVASPAVGRIELDVKNAGIVASLITEIGGDGINSATEHQLALPEFVRRFSTRHWDNNIIWQTAKFAFGHDTMFVDGAHGAEIQLTPDTNMGILTNDCLHYVANSTLRRSSNPWTEVEHAYYGKF